MFQRIPFLEKTVQSISGANDNDIQRAVLMEWLNSQPPEDVVQFLLYLWVGTLSKEPLHGKIYMSFLHAIHSDGSAWKRQTEIRDYARKAGAEAISDILDNPEPIRSIEEEMGIAENLGLEDVPLGVKKSLAKKFDRKTINKLLHEQDETVISILLKNPKIIEMDVMKIATKRPTSLRILIALFRSRRWISRYSIKRALILNPYNLPQISAGLLPFLKKKDLSEIAGDLTLHKIVRMAAERAIENG